MDLPTLDQWANGGHSSFVHFLLSLKRADIKCCRLTSVCFTSLHSSPRAITALCEIVYLQICLFVCFQGMVYNTWPISLSSEVSCVINISQTNIRLGLDKVNFLNLFFSQGSSDCLNIQNNMAQIMYGWLKFVFTN